MGTSSPEDTPDADTSTRPGQESGPGTGSGTELGPGLAWTVHPAADDPLRAVCLVGVMAIASLIAYRLTESGLFAVFTLIVLMLSLRAFFLPRHYTLDAEGAGETGPLCAPRRLGWPDVRKVARSRFGVYLSTLHSNSRFVRDRGLFLRTAGNRQQVQDFIHSVRPDEARADA